MTTLLTLTVEEELVLPVLMATGGASLRVGQVGAGKRLCFHK